MKYDRLKQRAFEYYMLGKDVAEVIRALKIEYDIPGKLMVVYKWARVEGWELKRLEAQGRAVVRVGEGITNSMALEMQDQLKAYQTAWKKGLESLIGRKALKFDKAIDAVRAVDVGVQGERKILSGILGLKFIQEIYTVLAEELKDKEVLERIGIRLKKLAIGNLEK